MGLNCMHAIRILLLSIAPLYYGGFSESYAEEHIVQVITDNDNGTVSFSPKTLTIKLGDTVTWINQNDGLHNVITYPDGYPNGASGFESPYMERKGEQWSYTFKSKGTYQYHCIPHIFMGMRGVVVVEIPTGRNGFHKPSIEETNVYRDSLLDFFDSEEFAVMPARVRRNVN